MSEDEQVGGAQPPRLSTAHLKPELGVLGTTELFAFVDDLLGKLDTEDETTVEEKREADLASARLARLGADAELYGRLALRGFDGAEYDLFRAELAAYALPVLRSFIRRKVIYPMCQQAARPVTATDAVREHLARDVDDRLQLACETVAQGLRLFERYALTGGRWSSERGASLKTYFIGACVRTFSTVFKRWVAEHDHPNAHALRLDAMVDLGVQPRALDDPADEVVGMQRVKDHLKNMNPKTRELAARVVLLGETHEEAGEAHGISNRAVEGQFYRHRTEIKRRAQTKRGTKKRGEA